LRQRAVKHDDKRANEQKNREAQRRDRREQTPRAVMPAARQGIEIGKPHVDCRAGGSAVFAGPFEFGLNPCRFLSHSATLFGMSDVASARSLLFAFDKFARSGHLTKSCALAIGTTARESAGIAFQLFSRRRC